MVREPAPVPSEAIAPDVAGIRLAGFTRRFLALLADYLVVGILTDIIGFAYRIGRGRTGAAMDLSAGFVVSFLLFAVYCTILLGENGQTLGKRLFAIRVLRSDGSSLTYGRAFTRTLLYVVSFFPFASLGFLWALWDRRNQTWHDKLVDTVVVRVGEKSKIKDLKSKTVI